MQGEHAGGQGWSPPCSTSLRAKGAGKQPGLAGPRGEGDWRAQKQWGMMLSYPDENKMGSLGCQKLQRCLAPPHTPNSRGKAPPPAAPHCSPHSSLRPAQYPQVQHGPRDTRQLPAFSHSHHAAVNEQSLIIDGHVLSDRAVS